MEHPPKARLNIGSINQAKQEAQRSKYIRQYSGYLVKLLAFVEILNLHSVLKPFSRYLILIMLVEEAEDR